MPSGVGGKVIGGLAVGLLIAVAVAAWAAKSIDVPLVEDDAVPLVGEESEPPDAESGAKLIPLHSNHPFAVSVRNRFKSPRAAVRALENVVPGAGIALPPALEATGPVVARGTTGHIQLEVPAGHGVSLTFQFGRAGFDGCGPHLSVVKVAGQPALATSARLTAGHHNVYSALVWPATVQDQQGQYAISGTTSVDHLLRYAEGMKTERGRPTPGPGC